MTTNSGGISNLYLFHPSSTIYLKYCSNALDTLKIYFSFFLLHIILSARSLVNLNRRLRSLAPVLASLFIEASTLTNRPLFMQYLNILHKPVLSNRALPLAYKPAIMFLGSLNLKSVLSALKTL